MKLRDEDILYEDKEIIVCHKPAGMAVQTSRLGEADMESALKNYLRTPYVGIVHRLDQPVEGIVVFAKTKHAAAKLSAQNAGQTMCKQYYAVAVPEKAGELQADGAGQAGEEVVLTDYLRKDGTGNISKAVEKGTPGAKRAELSYRILKAGQTEEGRPVLLLEVTLKTGRHHQIRVQLSHAGLPLLRDGKYGTGAGNVPEGSRQMKDLALCCSRLEFSHPVTGKRMDFRIEPAGAAFRIFRS